MNRILATFFIIVLFLVFSCEKETPPQVEIKPSAPKFEFEEIPIPPAMIQCPDSMAQVAVKYLRIANGITDYQNFYTPLDDAVDETQLETSKPWTWIISWQLGQIEWFNGNVSVKMQVDDEEDGYYWQTKVSFILGFFEWKDFRYFEGKLVEGDLSGFFRSWELWTGEWKRHWEWKFDTERRRYEMMVLISDKDEDPDLHMCKLEFTVQPDGKGRIDLFKIVNYDYEFVLNMQYMPDGSGSWYTYDENTRYKGGSWSCGGGK